MLFASVPEPVKIISDASEPTSRPITSRASSISLRTLRPGVCKLDGLPNFDSAVVIASIAQSSIGVVAA
ncbi:unannotated protein [freshwater metagenome]|uniref:Unannotated protein n=1 Tax=freshwater metagenome TaxID=449393 RepID=A0A6J7Q277_9ZZZZ